MNTSSAVIENKSNRSKRIHSIDLLRIIAMFFIVINHYLSHGVALMGFDFKQPFVYYDWYVRGVCYMGTNLFILITAFFISQSHFKIKHVLSLACQVWFYSIVLFLVSNWTGLSSFSLSSLFKSLAPIVSSQYWFITCYIALYFLAPFFNRLVATISRDGFHLLLVILFVCFSVIPSFFFFSPWVNWGGSSGIVWFVVLYFTGAYIRKYIDRESLKRKRKHIIIWTILFSLLPLISKIIIALFTNIALGHVVGSSLFYVKNSVILYPLSICFFLLFMTFDIKSGLIVKVIAFISTGIFAVYLITENANLRDWIWSSMTQIIDRNSVFYPVIELSVIAMLFLACVLIDKIRKILFELVPKTGIPNRIVSFLSPVIDTKYTAISDD